MNNCVCCGEPDIPEGRMVCPNCERKYGEKRREKLEYPQLQADLRAVCPDVSGTEQNDGKMEGRDVR